MRVALYVRVSTLRQAQAQTFEQQLDRLKAHVQANGWSVSEQNVFLDDGYSGSSLKRPGLDRLRDKVAAAEFDLLLITSPDRLARNACPSGAVARRASADGLPGRIPRPPDDPRSSRSTLAANPRSGCRI